MRELKKTFTSGEAARLCGLARSTIKRWVRRGRLRSYRTPGGDLRILREHLLDFMRQFDLPLTLLDNDAPPLLLLALDNEPWRDGLTKAAAGLGMELNLTVAPGDLDLGYVLGRTTPAFMVLAAQGEGDIDRCARIRELLAPRHVRIGMICTSAGPGGTTAGRVALPQAPGPEIVVVAGESVGWEKVFLSNLMGADFIFERESA